MIKIKIISVGKIKEKSLKTLIDEYLKRLSRFAKTEIVEINDLPVPDNPSENEINTVIAKEGVEISKHINPRSYVISMCIEGKKKSSEEFASFLNDTQNSFSEITFVIGSSHGLSDDIKKASNFKLSMSDMTFPHNVAKFMLIEQIYRSYKIINNENYHK